MKRRRITDGLPKFTPLRRGEAAVVARRNRHTNRWKLRAELDRLARAACLERAGHRCEKCGKRENLQWHHVYTRSILSLRHDLDNLVAICGGCHLWAHHNPLDFTAWFTDKYGPARADRLRLARATRRKTDLEALLIQLRARSGETEKGGGRTSEHE